MYIFLVERYLNLGHILALNMNFVRAKELVVRGSGDFLIRNVPQIEDSFFIFSNYNLRNYKAVKLSIYGY